MKFSVEAFLLCATALTVGQWLKFLNAMASTIRFSIHFNDPLPHTGHSMKECTGETKEKKGEFDELAGSSSLMLEKQFIFIRLCILREASGYSVPD